MTQHATSSATASHAAEGGKTAVQIAGRVGYATKGIVYMIVGGLAAAAAWGSGQATGSEGAVAKIGAQPFGQVLLWIIAVGLAAYCLWRLVEAVTDPDGKGNGARGIARRLGYALSGIIYGLLAWTAAPISGGSSGGGSQSAAAQLMSLPAGKWIVGALGLCVVGYGCYQLYKGLANKFMHKYDSGGMSRTEEMVAKYSGKFGLLARGITFGIIGLFVVLAAVSLDPGKVKGTGAALGVLAQQPYGPWVLLAVAIGLFCYGLFCLVQARYRNFRVGGVR